VSRFVLLGHPLGHSISPMIHRAAYECFGMHHEYELVDVPDEAAMRRQFEALRKRQIAGANVTVPHKRLALALADRADSSAERIGAANVLSREPEGSVVAYNTDALGLASALGDLSPQRDRALVIGNGGAALACVVACQHLGIGDVRVTARRFQPGHAVEDWPHVEEFQRLGARCVAWPEPDSEQALSLADAQWVLQATSVGMKGADSGEDLVGRLPWRSFGPGTLCYDLVYNPAETPFLRRAREAGFPAEGGLSMLVAQAQLAIEIWLGSLPPREPLIAAARQALEGKA